MRVQILFWACFVLMPSDGLGRAQASDERVLYKMALSEDQEMLVVQGPLVPASALKSLLSPQLLIRPLNSPTSCFSLSVELRGPRNQTLRLWSRLCWTYRDGEHGEYHVLDLLSLPGRNQLVMTMSGPGSAIVISEIDLYRNATRSTTIPGAQWSLLAAAVPVTPGRLSAKLTHDEKDLRIRVEVTDDLEQTKQHTLFEQRGDEWVFVRAKQWQEKASATSQAGE